MSKKNKKSLLETLAKKYTTTHIKKPRKKHSVRQLEQPGARYTVVSFRVNLDEKGEILAMLPEGKSLNEWLRETVLGVTGGQ